MSESVSPLTRICPNCGAHNYVNAHVCDSCGINLDAFERAQPDFAKQQQNLSQEQFAKLQAEARAGIKYQARAGRRQLSIQILLAIGLAVVVLALIAGVAAYSNYQQELRRERLASMYESANDCLVQENYLCARDGFASLLQEDPEYRDAPILWERAQYRYLEQQIVSGQGSHAITELEQILRRAPNDTRAQALLNQARYAVAKQLLIAQKWDPAVEQLQKILLTAPNDGPALAMLNQARYGLAAQSASQGKWSQAITELQKILLVFPNDANALALLRQVQVSSATQLAQQGKFQNAVNVLEGALVRFPNDPQLVALLRNVYDQWYNDAVSRGDWFTSLTVAAQRNLRFGSIK